ncbi:MAG TPA: efflux RND transporter periplasmic adaptor subunit [Polyangiaceae bacterium]|nr:efflux RND transporter periplasmic adaptor subunit [Polyangiaceae bacterium]
MKRRASLVLVLLLALGACRPAARHDDTELVTVRLSDAQIVERKIMVAPVVEQDVTAPIVTVGRVVFDDSRVAHVYSAVAGRVVHIDAALGQHVAAGDPLATLDSPDLGLVSADVRKAEADLVAAEHDYVRQRDLYEKQAASQATYEQARDVYLRAQAECDRVRQKLRLLSGSRDGHVTQTYVLRSPIDGEVVARAVSPGLEVRGLYGGGEPAELFTIGRTDRVWVLADVHEADLARVRPGAPVRVTVIAYPDRSFEGHLDWISDVLDTATRTARVRCTLANDAGALEPEMFATVSISTLDLRALAVPRSAVVRLGEHTMVFVEAPRAPGELARFDLRPVAVDDYETGPWVVVERGLAPGVRVVVSGASELASVYSASSSASP